MAVGITRIPLQILSQDIISCLPALITAAMGGGEGGLLAAGLSGHREALTTKLLMAGRAMKKKELWNFCKEPSGRGMHLTTIRKKKLMSQCTQRRFTGAALGKRKNINFYGCWRKVVASVNQLSDIDVTCIISLNWKHLVERKSSKRTFYVWGAWPSPHTTMAYICTRMWSGHCGWEEGQGSNQFRENDDDRRSTRESGSLPAWWNRCWNLGMCTTQHKWRSPKVPDGEKEIKYFEIVNILELCTRNS